MSKAETMNHNEHPPEVRQMTPPPRPQGRQAPAPCEAVAPEPVRVWQLLLPLMALPIGAWLTWRLSLESGMDGTHSLPDLGGMWLAGLALSSLACAAGWAALHVWRRVKAHTRQSRADLEVLARVALSSPDPLALLDRELRFSWVNLPFLDWHGGHESDVYGESFLTWLAAQRVAPEALRRLESALAQRLPATLELGSPDTRHTFVYLAPSHDANSAFKGYTIRFDDTATHPAFGPVLERLQRENEALRNTIDQLAIVSEADRAGNITRVNRKFIEISGYSEDELIGKNHRIVNSEMHPREFWMHMWATIAQGRPWRGEVCNRSKDGRLYWVDSLVAPILDPQGKVERYISIRTDITHFRRAEAALAASQRMLARTGSLARTGGWYYDLGTRQLYMSAECMRIFGAEPDWTSSVEEILGYREPHHTPAVARLIETVNGREEAFEQVIEITLNDQRHRHVRLMGEFDRRTEGTPRLLGAAQDVTAQIEAQRRAEQSESVLRSAIHAMDEAFALYDTDDRLLFCNDKYRHLVFRNPDDLRLGTAYEDVIRQSTADGLLMAEGMDRETWIADRILRSRRHESSEIRKLNNGRWIRFVDYRTPDGFHVALRVDVTELQQSLETAQAASRAKSQFLANMSHEIRTPMSAVMGMLQLMQHTELNDKQRDLTDKASTAARALLGVVNDILDYSKVEAGKMSLDPQPFDLDALLADLSVIVSNTLGEKRLDVVFDLDPGVPRALMGDSLRLKQGLINLCANAIKFTETGTVVLAVQQTDATEGSVQLSFEVSDTGPGMSPEQLQRLFQEYEQADASTARRHGGTGLGLMISRQLVGLMGGTLDVSSQLGQGSTFRFAVTMPIVDPVGLAQAVAPALNRPAVWLVDRHPSSRRAVQRTLHALGCKVQAFSSVPAARQRLDTNAEGALRCDVLLMDLDTSAEATANETRALIQQLQRRGMGALAELPVLTLSSCGIEAFGQQECPLSLQWEHVLIKPLTPQTLGQALRRALSQEQATAAPRPTATPLEGLHVLLVEDDLLNQHVAMELLRLQGADVVLEPNGQAAVARLTEQPDAFDVVLMDMEMPVLDGLAATRQIRQIAALEHLPVVAMTANISPADGQACLDAGMNAHIGKPFDVNALVRTVLERVALARSAGHPPARPALAAAPTAAPTADTVAAHGRDAGLTTVFLRVAPTYLQRLGQALEQHDVAQLKALAHQVKGSAAMLGERALSAAAADLEAACRMATDPWSTAADHPVTVLASAFRQTLEATVASRTAPTADHPAPADPPDHSPAAPPFTELQQDLRALLAAARSADMVAYELMDTAWARHGAWHPELAAVRDAIEVVDFDGACALLEPWLQRLGGE